MNLQAVFKQIRNFTSKEWTSTNDPTEHNKQVNYSA